MQNINHDELGIYSSAPKSSVHFVERLTKAFYYLFLHPRAVIAGDILWVLVGIGSVTWFFRNSGNIWLSVILCIALLGISLAYSNILPRIYTWFTTLFFGKPVFGKLGGLDRVTFFTILKSSPKIRIDLKESEKEIAKKFCELDNDLTEGLFRERYYALYGEQASREGTDMEAQWKNLWENKLLMVGTGKATFQNVRNTENLGFRVMPLKLQNATMLISPFIKFFQLFGIVLIVAYLAEWMSLLTAIQIMVALNLILSIFWYLLYSYNMSDIALIVPDETVLSKDLYQKHADKISGLQNKSIKPINITIENSFFTDIRTHQLRFIGAFTLLNSLYILGMLLLVVGAQALFIGLGEPASKWYLLFGLGILLLPIGFYVGFFFISVIIQHFRKVLGSLVVGVTTAVLPFFIYYLIKGQLQINEVQNGIWAALSGITTILSTIVASQFREILESEPKKDSDKK
ncbi:MAG: hypothetical protein IPM47_05035 [Sphingobacteriales bacterium]|nr:MAG: hypothetical protein IPM47_05035 [Sphingobacteriales bacterium]